VVAYLFLVGDILHMLRERLEANAKDSNVAGFKSVVCYRTGLEVSTVPTSLREIGLDRYHHIHPFERTPAAGNKPLNDLVVRRLSR